MPDAGAQHLKAACQAPLYERELARCAYEIGCVLQWVDREEWRQAHLAADEARQHLWRAIWRFAERMD